jgi:hypothetical protein
VFKTDNPCVLCAHTSTSRRRRRSSRRRSYVTHSEHPFRGRNRQDCQSSTELSYETEMIRTIGTQFDTRCTCSNTLESALSGRSPSISPLATIRQDDPIK